MKKEAQNTYITTANGSLTVTKAAQTVTVNADGSVTTVNTTTSLTLSTVKGQENTVLQATQETETVTHIVHSVGDEETTITSTGQQKIGVGQASLIIGAEGVRQAQAAAGPPGTLSHFLPTLSADARAHPWYYVSVVAGGAAIPFLAAPAAIAIPAGVILGGTSIGAATIDHSNP